MVEMLPLWVHVLAATVWVGSQVMMFAVVVPSIRALADGRARYDILRSITRRFGYLGLGALLLLIASGIDNVTRHSPGDMFDIRYGYILATKLVMVGIVLLLTLLHTLAVGPAQLRLMQEELDQPGSVSAAQSRALRMRSVSISVLTLLLSLAIVFCAVLLRSGYAYGTF